jgi:hypothetical protein
MAEARWTPRYETFPIYQSPLAEFSKESRLRKLDRCNVAYPQTRFTQIAPTVAESACAARLDVGIDR